MGNGVGNATVNGGIHGDTACLVAQAAILDALRQGKKIDKPTDELACACPLLRRMAIAGNDAKWWKDYQERTEVLQPLIPLLLGSRGDLALTKRRAARYSNAMIHELTPMRLQWIAANTKNVELAKSCLEGIQKIEKIAPIEDKTSALSAREVLCSLKNAAYAAADAYVDTYAYAVADTYAYAVAAYAYAVADTAYATYAAAYAQKRKYRNAWIALFKELAAMK